MTLAHTTSLPPASESPVLLAISGGCDSVVLLHLLVAAGQQGLVLCHLNHGLRGRESGQDAAFVRRLAHRYGLACEVEKADVASLASTRGLSVETAAREVRYEFLRRMAQKHQAPCIYLAHHADDQAETILANLCRGTGIGGLKGMLEQTPSHPSLCRPLLRVPRQVLEAYAREHGLVYREDSSNVSPVHRRNRLRHEVLPLLNDVYAREVAPLILRLGHQAARDDDCLQQQALAFMCANKVLNEDGSLRASPSLRALHRALLSRVIHHWLREVMRLPEVDSTLVERAMAMLEPGGVAKINLPGNGHLRRKAGRLWVQPSSSQVG